MNWYTFRGNNYAFSVFAFFLNFADVKFVIGILGISRVKLVKGTEWLYR